MLELWAVVLLEGSMDQQAPETAQLWDSREAWRKTQGGGTNAAHLAEHLVLLKTRGGHLIPLHHAGKQADICILWIGGGRKMWKCFVRRLYRGIGQAGILFSFKFQLKLHLL